jgi:deoxyhypusine synthase
MADPVQIEKQNGTPSKATEAVLKPSDPVPDTAQEVRGIDFNHYAGRNVTVEDLVENLRYMGFQASSVGEATRIINDMVLRALHPKTTTVACSLVTLD